MTHKEEPQATGLAGRVASARGRIKELEAAYETITVGQLVSLRARTHGAKVAIDVFERNERATYREVDQLSNKYAWALRNKGIRKGDRVAIMLPNRIEFPILWFALAKLGAVMVPINIRFTSREIEYCINDTEAKLIITDESCWGVFGQIERWPEGLDRSKILLIDESPKIQADNFTDLLKEVDDGPIHEDVHPDDILNIQYTSGTTGFPKGCMLTHDYWGINSYQSIYWDYQPYDRILLAGFFFYVDGGWILLKSYRHGATMYMAPQISSTRFVEWLATYRIEWCGFPELVVRQPPSPHDSQTCLSQISQYSGWTPETERRFAARFPGIRNQGGYGMTEISWGTQMPCNMPEMAESGSLGIVSPFRTLRLVDDNGHATPDGEIGEIWVRGRGIFKGYWNKPDANAEVFQDGWFKTGDLARRDALGFHWLVGRKKEVIRRSSENISAREVEAVLRELPQIADAAAIPVRDDRRGEEVKVCLELKPGLTPADLPVDRILEHARGRLAAFKVPRYIAFFDLLPRTASSNKVLKRDLVNVSDPLRGTYDSEEQRWR